MQLRRYSEFALLDELLRRRYSNRIIAAFPAKEAGMARASFSSPGPEFIEARRSQLSRWLTSIMYGSEGNFDMRAGEGGGSFPRRFPVYACRP